MRRTKPAELTEEEKRIHASQRQSRQAYKQSHKNQDSCYATLLLGVINQAIIDTISSPIEIKVFNARNVYDKERFEKERKTGREFLDSDNCEAFLAWIRILGRTAPNIRYIASKCDEIVASGTYLTKDRLEYLVALGNSDAETVEVPLSSDRLAA